MKLFVKYTLIGVATLASGVANAYTTYSCGGGSVSWNTNVETLYAYTGSFPPGSAERSALNDAMQELNRNSSQFRFDLVYDSTAPSLGSSRNEIWIENISPPGVANFWWNGACNLTKVKIRLDSSVSWTTSA